MNKFLSLLKVELMQTYSINGLKKKHNPKRKLGSYVAIGVLGLFLFAAIMILQISMGIICKETGQLDYLLAFSITAGSFLCLTMTITKAYGFLFEAKDFELLTSMPINNKTIILSKLSCLLILNYMGFGLLYIPSIISYGIFGSPGLIFYVLSIITFITAPLLIITVCSFISYFLGIALKKVKYKSIIMSILSLMIFIVFFTVYMLFVNKMDYVGTPEDELKYFSEFFGSIKNNFMTYYPICKWAIFGMNGNYLYYLLYLVVEIIPFGLLVIFVGKNFLKANMRAKISYTNKNFVLTDQKQNSKIGALLKRDFKRFFSSSSQVLNIGIGPILSTILVATLGFNFSKNMPSDDVDILSQLFPLLLLLMAGFTFGIMPSTSSSISLEGKNFWILKSSPLKTKDIFISKILFYVIICFPFIIINTIIINIITELSIFDLVLIFITQLVLVFTYSVEGLWVNILTPKFDWDNEVKAIKQGAGTLLSMLLGFALGIIIYVAPFILINFGFNGILLTCINALLVLIVMAFVLFTHGKNRYEKIQA